ncbi:hypothetical protein GL325_12805 [Aeromicrobium sp. 636]|uniref:Uncharacterized protein n=1 Tax=Aeromicrobium senzhongii TaxID=2663859 RepID=A0A8I0EVK0_9ACTN|nr:MULTISPECIES: hypothetical protein [Aeromicrobium]MBC9227206.1 hypothetical protein [Aeromicrobium senzhongii]MCQ3999305.1 hypothetical protein [Aeromicrobium sp. 636]MTB88383.1 hypothetical protein [Aeromicrobium senzhongii]QNL94645.1 hypothetical protein H9L21_01335 [Aeromicrobium senzhongii]
MSHAKAIKVDPREPEPDLAAPLGETPVARPGFRRSMVLLVLLSVPLWAVIIGGGYLAVRALG